MRKAPWSERVERGRDTNPESHTCSRRGDDFGFFFLRPNVDIGRDTLRIMASSGDEHIRWEHVSRLASKPVPDVGGDVLGEVALLGG